ncbi:N-acetylmuramoyl-L-alanine amidase [Halovulum sp. GXIMD14794]
MKQVTSTPLRRLAGAFLAVLASCAPLLAETGEPVRLARIEASFWGGHRVELDLPEPVAWRAFVVDGPPRLVVDVEADGLEADPSLLSGAIVGASAGRLASGWSRLVLTLERTLAVQKAGLDDGVLAISLERIGQGGFEKAARLAPGREALAGPPEGARPPEAGKLRIVLDPGHGGVDPGASRGGVREKDIALAFGLEFAAMLEDTGRYDVALTRRDDRFLLLDDRVAFARAAEAALFLSLHANTVTEGKASGAAIYVTSRIASDPASARVALLENRSDQAAGMPGDAEQDDVTLTLFDMARPATEARARMAAERVVAALGETTGVIRSRPLRAADFRVLRAPDMPSLLLELGFLSDPGDLADMQSPEWRADVGRALIRALDEWREADEDFLALMRQ